MPFFGTGGAWGVRTKDFLGECPHLRQEMFEMLTVEWGFCLDFSFAEASLI